MYGADEEKGIVTDLTADVIFDDSFIDPSIGF